MGVDAGRPCELGESPVAFRAEIDGPIGSPVDRGAEYRLDQDALA